MADLVLRVGSRSEQGLRANNEDCLLTDLAQSLFVVADGMGGQELGELASRMAIDIIPRVVEKSLAAQHEADKVLVDALHEANRAIIEGSRSQQEGRRMGTTVVAALHRDGRVFVAHVGDSRAYRIGADRTQQLTTDHSVAAALAASGALTPEEARQSRFNHVLHKFLGCTSMLDGADVTSFEPEPGDLLLLASDGLTNHLDEQDLREGRAQFADPQQWADHLVHTALTRGSRDNVTCIIVAFAKE